MKKAKALQDFNYGAWCLRKGDVLELSVCGGGYLIAGKNYLIPASIVETNPHIFECPYEEKLTSEQWDEKARGYGYFIPRDGEMCYLIDLKYRSILDSSWDSSFVDIFSLRAGLAFETREEAEELLKKLKKERA